MQIKDAALGRACSFLVRTRGLEPPRLAALDPKSSASASSAMPADGEDPLAPAHCSTGQRFLSILSRLPSTEKAVNINFLGCFFKKAMLQYIGNEIANRIRIPHLVPNGHRVHSPGHLIYFVILWQRG